jgi:hypothetical protein
MSTQNSGGALQLYKPFRGDFAITQIFGVNPANYVPYAGHMGVDYATPVGTPLFAPAAGIITETPLLTYGYGRHVKMKLPSGIVIVFGHMSAVAVVKGEVVEAKTRIGESGGSKSDPYAGYSTGAHLHFEIRVPGLESNGFGGAVDPLPYLISWEEDMSQEPALWRGQISGTSRVNVRAKPATGTTAVVGSLLPGNTVEVLETTKVGSYDWHRIRWIETAWVRGDLVVRLPDIPSDVPAEVLVGLQQLLEHLRDASANADILSTEIDSDAARVDRLIKVLTNS